MKRKRTSYGIVLVTFSLVTLSVLSRSAVLGADEASPLTAHDVAALRSVDEVALSPDGKQVAFTLVVPRRPGQDDNGPAWRELQVVDTDGELRRFVTGDVAVEKIAWSGDGSVMSFLAERGEDEGDTLYRIAVDGGEARRVLAHGDGIDEYAWAPDGRSLIFLAKREVAEEKEALEERGFDQQVFEEEWRPVEVWMAAAEGDDVSEPEALGLSGSASMLAMSPAGDRFAVALAPTSLVDDRYMKRRIHIVASASGEIIGQVETSGKLEKLAWSPSGRQLALIAGADANDPAAARLMLVGDAGGEPSWLLRDIEGDVMDLAWQDDSNLVVVIAEGVERALMRVAVTGEATVLLRQPGTIWTRISAAGQASGLALVGQSAFHPDEVFHASAPGEGVQRLTESNPWLDERRLATQEVIDFPARDGLSLQGLLIRPLDRDPRERVPLVLMVHGGPEAHFTNGWLTNYSRPGQVLAAAGYAVFYPNYRGSTGRGIEFAKSSQGDPAGKEFDDLIDGVDYLIGRGLADARRVGITGGSYGGYATAWGSTFFSERFAAGVMFVGISEKVSKIGTSDIPNELYLVHARRWPWENWQLMLERSPVYYVEKAATPLLILGGDQDPRVHPSQSLTLYRYLKILGKSPVRYVVYPGEKHGNRKAAARLDYTLRLLRWFDHYLVGPGGDPPPPDVDYGLDEDAGEEQLAGD